MQYFTKGVGEGKDSKKKKKKLKNNKP